MAGSPVKAMRPCDFGISCKASIIVFFIDAGALSNNFDVRVPNHPLKSPPLAAAKNNSAAAGNCLGWSGVGISVNNWLSAVGGKNAAILFITDCIAGHCAIVAGDNVICACGDGVFGFAINCDIGAGVGVSVMIVPAGKFVAG